MNGGAEGPKGWSDGENEVELLTLEYPEKCNYEKKN